jgi:uncharacterized protein (DUF1501 family)
MSMNLRGAMNEVRGIDRRRLLAGGVAGGLLALPGRGWPSAVARARLAAEDEEPPVLVVIELIGGNDGLSTLVPYTDDRYYALREELHIPADDVLRVDERLGFNPHLRGLRDVYEQGELAVVQGVGYPQPVYSHFKSFEIWHAASPAGRAAGDGWIARLRAAAWGDDPRPELVVHVGYNQPYSLHSPDYGVLSFESPEKYLWAGAGEARTSFREAAEVEPAEGAPRSAVLSRLYRTLRHSQRTSPEILAAASTYEPSVEYPGGMFVSSLQTIAALIEARVGARVFSCNLDGFDTHANQIRRHAQLMKELDHGLAAFRADLAGRSSAPRVVVAVVSEFGRRAAENHSEGTDHGAAGLTFLMGARVKGGLYGQQPALDGLDQDGNLVYNVDFRSVYATLIEDWFGVPQTRVLDGSFPKLPVLKA